MWRVNGRFLRSSVPSCHVPFAHTFLRLFVRSLHPITSRPGSSRLLTSLAASPAEPGLRRDGPIRRGNGMTRDRQPTQLMTRRTCYPFPLSAHPSLTHLSPPSAHGRNGVRNERNGWRETEKRWGEHTSRARQQRDAIVTASRLPTFLTSTSSRLRLLPEDMDNEWP